MGSKVLGGIKSMNVDTLAYVRVKGGVYRRTTSGANLVLRGLIES